MAQFQQGTDWRGQQQEVQAAALQQQTSWQLTPPGPKGLLVSYFVLPLSRLLLVQPPVMLRDLIRIPWAAGGNGPSGNSHGGDMQTLGPQFVPQQCGQRSKSCFA